MKGLGTLLKCLLVRHKWDAILRGFWFGTMLKCLLVRQKREGRQKTRGLEPY